MTSVFAVRQAFAARVSLVVFMLLRTMAVVACAEDAKFPVPDDASQAAAAKLVADVYREDISKAKTPEEKMALAKMFLDLGGQTKDDPAGRFVLFALARDMAIDAGDVLTTLSAADAIVSSYNTQSGGLDLLAKLSKTVKAPTQRKELAGRLRAKIDAAVAADCYEVAEEAGNIQLQMARRSGDSKMSAQAALSVKNIQEFKAAYETAKPALATLEKQPADPDANLVAGRFYCFVKGDWEKGLPMLALANDEDLRAAAEADIKGAADASAQVALGDQWWALAEETAEKESDQLKLRAAKYYKEAVPQLQGLAKAKVSKRLQDVVGPTPKPAPPPAPNPPQNPGMKATIYGICDDQFWLCVNGKEVLRGGWLAKAEVEIKRGDIITARVIDRGGARGFGCVIKTPKGVITTGLANGWFSYLPKNPQDWGSYRGEELLKVLREDQEERARMIKAESGVPCVLVWGTRAAESFLVLKVE